MNKLLLSTLAASGLAVGSASAAVVFNDTFDSGVPGDYGYRLIRNAGAGVASSISSGSLLVDLAASGSQNTGIYKKFTDQTLTNVGDSITLSFNLSFTSTASTSGSAFRIMLGQSSIAGTGAVDFNAFPTDTLFTTMRLGNGTSTSASIRSHVTVDGANISTLTGTNTNFTQAVGTSSITSVAFSFTKTASGIDIGGSLNGNSIGTFSRTDTSLPDVITTFNFFGIYQNSSTTNLDFTIDNVSLVTAIPEPSSAAALAGLGVLGLVATRRRRA